MRRLISLPVVRWALAYAAVFLISNAAGAQTPPQVPSMQPAWTYAQPPYSVASLMPDDCLYCDGQGVPSVPCAIDAPYGAQAPCYGGCAPAAGDCSYAAAPWVACAPPIAWYGRAGALLYFREESDHHFFSFDSAIETNQLLDFRDAQTEFAPGVEARVARIDCCTLAGWEAVYWGLYPSDQITHAFAGDVTGFLDPILDYSQLDYNGGSAEAYVNAAIVHRLRGSSEIHNAEFNRLWGIRPHGGCSPWTGHWLAGFRYFRFEEDLEFAADTVDAMFTGSADELYYTIDANNNLYGFQLGAGVERASAGGHWSFNCEAKAGIFANDASATSRIGGAAGTATVNNGPNAGRAWLVSADKTDVAMIGELRAGLGRQLGWRWRAVADYRVLAASGVATPTNQIYHDLRGVNDVELLSTDGVLFLHGVFVGLECAY